MTHFADATGREWTVSLDGLLLGDLRDEARVDLTDGAGWVALEADVVALTRALCVLCREQIAERKLTRTEFARALSGECLESAGAAVRGAAIAFFPTKSWSSIQSSSAANRRATTQLEELRPLLRVLADKDMPQAMIANVLAAIADGARATGDSASTSSLDGLFARGPAASRDSPVADSPASAASVPAA